ncbi:hypothetical protein [Deinococcus multiflagellatus]|uniref:Uncharacterized protein n=1 Tax=Deinococcus multiflagellatus TaxID=1656887 RepID=A0ABW1ZNA3_9DEIO|nr:hypothetical protein [Deinococcus multiflagellatus]MBZ9715241.1 hypothetical protein [Deinococcus multiflagellatus]
MESDVVLTQHQIREEVARASALLRRHARGRAASALEEWYLGAFQSPEELKYIGVWARFLNQQVSGKEIAA